MQKNYAVKNGSIDNPKMYFVTDIGKVYKQDGSHDQTMSSDSYIKEAVNNVNTQLSIKVSLILIIPKKFCSCL